MDMEQEGHQKLLHKKKTTIEKQDKQDKQHKQDKQEIKPTKPPKTPNKKIEK